MEKGNNASIPYSDGGEGATYLNKHGAYQSEYDLIPQGVNREPDGRGKQQRDQPEEGSCYQYDDPDRVVCDGQREHRQRWPEGQECAAEELHYGHG